MEHDAQATPPRELVIRAARGDSRAFSTLVVAYERTALSVAFAVLGGDEAAAADAVQEAFIKAWQRLPELKDFDRFPGWLGQIVRRAALDLRRRRPLSAALDVASFDVAVAGDDPAAGLERDDTRRGIDAALAELDEMTRIAVVLRYYDDLSSRQIGDVLDLSPAAVDTRLNRARNALRQKLTPMSERMP